MCDALRVVAAEVFGRFDENSRRLLRELVVAHCEGVDARFGLRRRLELGWQRQWSSLLSVAVQNSVAASFVPAAPPFDGADTGLRPRHHTAHDHWSLLEVDHEGPEDGLSRLPLRG